MEQNFLPQASCDLLSPLEKDPVHIARKALDELSRRPITKQHEISLIEATGLVLPILNAPSSVVNALVFKRLYEASQKIEVECTELKPYKSERLI